MKTSKLTLEEAKLLSSDDFSFKRLPNQTLEQLSSNGFIIKDHKDELSIFRDYYRNHGNLRIGMMYLLTNDGCNLRCRYCFEGIPIQHMPVMMNNETSRKSIDLFYNLSQNYGEERTIIFYGGEPLLNEAVIRNAIDYIRTYSDRFPTRISIVTNGTLITGKLAKFFSRNKVRVSVSIDGRPEVHNDARIFQNGRKTFEEAKRGYMFCKNNGGEPSISLTISSSNIHSLRENVEYLVDTLNPSAFGMNFLLDLPNSPNPKSVPIELATEKYIEAFKYLRDKGIFEDRAIRKIRPFVEERVHLKDCGGVGNQIVIAPDGSIGTCHAFYSQRKFFHVNLSKPEDILNNPDFNEWASRYPLNMPQCYDCEAIGICGGGCPYQAYIKDGSIWELDERMCKHNKAFLKWLVWDTYDANSKNKIQDSNSK